MKLPTFEYACPTTISEAVALLAIHDGEAKPLAGGQSLVPMMAFRVAPRRHFSSIYAGSPNCGRSRSPMTASGLAQ